MLDSRALRLTLHLNVAACALKREDWYLAREAARNLEARFVMATNTEMSMEPETPEHFEHLVRRAITVTDEETRKLQVKHDESNLLRPQRFQ